MEPIDRQKAQRVWQRVQSAHPAAPLPMGMNPEGLLLEEITDAQLLEQLARQTKEPTNLRVLAQQCQHRASILRGICKLASLTPPSGIPKPGRQDNSPATLRRIMGRLLRRLQEYRRLSEHEEFGPLYEALGELTRDTTVLLSQVIGK